jgi:hypothetical protein
MGSEQGGKSERVEISLGVDGNHIIKIDGVVQDTNMIAAEINRRAPMPPCECGYWSRRPSLHHQTNCRHFISVIE